MVTRSSSRTTTPHKNDKLKNKLLLRPSSSGITVLVACTPPHTSPNNKTARAKVEMERGEEEFRQNTLVYFLLVFASDLLDIVEGPVRIRWNERLVFAVGGRFFPDHKVCH